MVDMHCHILPSIDDGSSSFEESVKMIENAIKCGITDIIITPHFIYNSKFNADNEKKISLFNELVEYTKNLDINLYLGNEIYYKNDLSNNMDSILSLNNSKYLLIEFPFNILPVNVLNELHELMIKGYKIIIAHPERYSYFQDDVNSMIKFLDKGILFQGNIGSLFGVYGKSAKKALKRMIKCNMIHFLSSDSHKGNDGKYEFYKKIHKVIDSDVVKELTFTNPRLVISNNDIKVKEYKTVKSIFKKNHR